MKTEVTFNGINRPQCNKCNKETNITLVKAETFMNKDFSTKKTKATFFCEEHKGHFSISGKDIFNYCAVGKV
jgi:hypothetical protein